MSLPRFLILETSSQPGLVALGEGHNIVGVRRLEEARRHARDLVPAVAELLGAHGWKPPSIAAVLVSRGPGSYTGLRVGMISAKTFAYAARCTLLTLDTFAVLARQVPAEVQQVAVVADAQQDKIYVQEYARTAPGEALTSTAALRIESVSAWLESRPEALWVTGPGLRKIAAGLPPRMTPVDTALWDPQPATLLQLGTARYSRGEKDDVWAAEPLYLRPSAAEEQWSRRLQAGEKG